MDIQRLRNLTTGRLHTNMSHIYQDIEYFTGEEGIMTHMLPNACRALEPYLKKKLKDIRFWDGKYDTSHTGNIDIKPMDKKEREDFFKQYAKSPSLLADKEVIVVQV